MRYPAVLDEATTLHGAVLGKSMARFGDGELKLALGRDAKSQAADPALAKALRQVLKDTVGPALVCIPNIGRSDGVKEAFWKQYRTRQYVGLYRMEGIYGSAFVTRPDSAPYIQTPAYWRLLREVWRGQDVVLVRGSTKSLVAGELTGARSVEEVVGPRQHAWAASGELLARLRGEKRRVLLCLGATATVLAWRLAHEGVHAFDLGHVGMFMRKVDRGEAVEVTEADRRS